MKSTLPFIGLTLISCATDDNTSVDTVAELNEQVEEEVEDVPEQEQVEVDGCLPVEGAEGARFAGQIEYPDGTLADRTNTRIHMCSGSCQIAQWGDDGFCYPEGELSPGVYAFKVIPTGFEDHATPLTMITIGADDLILEEPVYVPEFSRTDDLVDGVFEAGNGLEIKVVSEQFTPYFDGDDYIAAVDVDPMESGLPLFGIDTDKIVGMWYLGAFDAEISPMWSFEVYETGLPAGTTLKIMNASYSDRKWLDVGTATVADDGVLYTDADSGLSVLSTLILIEE